MTDLQERIESILANRTFPDAEQCEEGTRRIIEAVSEVLYKQSRTFPPTDSRGAYYAYAAGWLRIQLD